MAKDSDIFTLNMPPANHWHHVPVVVPYRSFGMGSQRPFSWYFEGESSVKVKKYREVCKWLVKCKYKKDAALFGRPDVWQHPLEFEKLKKGDCDDHALWAWRKLVEIGLEAQLVCGTWREPGSKTRPTGHAWVIFKKSGKKSWHILECTEKNTKKMVIPAKDAEKRYFPELSVDGEFKTYRFTIAKDKRY
jgi:hypothetical protein